MGLLSLPLSRLLKVISSPFYACAKQMFTSAFTNKYSDIYLIQDCKLFSLPFHYLYSKQSLFRRNRTSKRYPRRVDIPWIRGYRVDCTRLDFRHFAWRIYTELGTSCNFIRKVTSSGSRQTKMAGHVQNGLETPVTCN